MIKDFALKDNKNPILENTFYFIREKASRLLSNRVLNFHLTGIWEEINGLMKGCLMCCRSLASFMASMQQMPAEISEVRMLL